MFPNHVPQFLIHISALGRHVITYGHAGTRAVLGTFFHLQSPRDAFRVALRQSRFSREVGSSDGSAKALFLIHYHIFKNAGTSFEWALQQTFGPGFRQFDSKIPGGRILPRDIARLAKREPQLVAISSHQAMPPAPRILSRKVLTSILIRDPIARIGSIYSFERAQKTETPGAVKAKELDFKNYVEWRLQTSPAAICNYQVYFCSGRKHGAAECGQRDLEAAIIRLDAIDVVGTVRRYDEWLALAEAVLRQHAEKLTLASAHHNRSRPKSAISEAEILERLTRELGSSLTEELLQRNELDMCLHQVADALLTRRLAERSVAIMLRESYAEARETALRKSPSSQP
jgi:hypothetical protein